MTQSALPGNLNLNAEEQAWLLEQVRQRVESERARRVQWQPSDPQDAVAWMARNFFLYDSRQLITFIPEQVAALLEALSLDADGKYRYTTVVWSWPKKSAKSSVIAAVADFIACHKPNARIRLVGNDLDQADSRVGFYMRENIKLGAKYAADPKMKQFRKNTKISTSNYRITYPNGSMVQMVPVDPSGEAGGNDDMVVCSELWGWKKKAHAQMWTETTISPTRFGYAQRWVDTYAGFDGESLTLQNLYDSVVKSEYQLRPDLEMYGNPAAHLFATWVTHGLFSWHTADFYAHEATQLTPDEFRRIHKNDWVSSTQAFVDMAWWNVCLALPEERPHFTLRRMDGIVIGIDAGLTSDCFGIIAVSRREDNVFVQYARKWEPQKGNQVQFGNERTEDTPVYELYRLARTYNILRFAYDPWQLEKLAQDLNVAGLGKFEPIAQTNAITVADKMLYDAIVQRRLIHQGHHDLTEHVKNANRKAESDNRLRIVKRADHLKIDLAKALSMAVYKAYEVLPG